MCWDGRFKDSNALLLFIVSGFKLGLDDGVALLFVCLEVSASEGR